MFTTFVFVLTTSVHRLDVIVMSEFELNQTHDNF